jgi:hypothetical protein
MTGEHREPRGGRLVQQERLRDPLAPSDIPVFAVREWASRFYAQERLRRDAAWWRIGWPFVLALLLAGGALAAGRHWPPQDSDAAMGVVVVLASAAAGVGLGGIIRWRAVSLRRRVAGAHPATVENVPSAARAAVLGSPRLRFRRPVDDAAFLAVRDDVAAQAPVGLFAATVLVWALLMRDSVEGTLEDWVQGRRG